MVLCVHNKNIYFCKECGGDAYCSHGKRKTRCKECGGGSICIHNRRRYDCKECKGGGVCIHKKEKFRCKDCKGISLCIHKIEKYRCKECKGGGICIHNREKYICKDCKGKGICIHDKRKSSCKECGGSGLCIHDKVRSICKKCKGGHICIHNNIRSVCKKCKGGSICIHNKEKRRCKECGGRELCKTELCEIQICNNKYKGYCVRCFIHLFPDEKVSQNYKIKEKHCVDFIKQYYEPNICDKIIGESKRRPDAFYKTDKQNIIIEIDENQHRDYDCSCENKRIMQLWQDINSKKPLVFIRFNPDGYIDKDENEIKTPWRYCKKTGILIVDKKRKKEWEKRLNILKETLEYWFENKSDKEIQIIQLFYNQN